MHMYTHTFSRARCVAACASGSPHHTRTVQVHHTYTYIYIYINIHTYNYRRYTNIYTHFLRCSMRRRARISISASHPHRAGKIYIYTYSKYVRICTHTNRGNTYVYPHFQWQHALCNILQHTNIGTTIISIVTLYVIAYVNSRSVPKFSHPTS